jgi:superfamily II helicase
MKVRNCFVSNSSSASYVVAIKNVPHCFIEELKKVKKCKECGNPRFMKLVVEEQLTLYKRNTWCVRFFSRMSKLERNGFSMFYVYRETLDDNSDISKFILNVINEQVKDAEIVQITRFH